MKQWTLRELLLLLTVLSFALYYISESVHRRVLPFAPFEVRDQELTGWAREVDPASSMHRYVVSGGTWPDETGRHRMHHLEMEVSADQVMSVVRHWQKRIDEKIVSEGWNRPGAGSSENVFSYSLARPNELYDVDFSHSTSPPSKSWSMPKPNTVRLDLHWVEVGYIRYRNGKRLVQTGEVGE